MTTSVFKFLPFLGLLIFTSISCTKNTNPPHITLNGERNTSIALGEDFVDPGATAENFKGDDISDDVKMTDNINNMHTGEYMVYYDVEDQNGKKANTVERVVQVENSADHLNGFYSVSYAITSTSTSVGTSIDEIKTSESINNRFYVENPAAFYATISGNDVTVPLQGNINTGQWQGSGTVESNGNITFNVIYSTLNQNYNYNLVYEKH